MLLFDDSVNGEIKPHNTKIGGKLVVVFNKHSFHYAATICGVEIARKSLSINSTSTICG